MKKQCINCKHLNGIFENLNFQTMPDRFECLKGKDLNLYEDEVIRQLRDDVEVDCDMWEHNK